MKKFIRFLAVVVAVLILAIVILGIVEPKQVSVQRSTLIKAPKSLVFDQIINLRNFMHWNPWYNMDSSEQITYSGTDGQPGSSFHWAGDPKKTGEGDMIDTAVKDGEMDYQLHFLKPYKGNADGFIRAEDAGNGMTKATWEVTMHVPFPYNSMLAFQNMDKMLGGDYERGLENLKKYAESLAASGVQIQEVQYPAHTFAGIRKTINMAEMGKFFADSYSQIGKAIGSAINGAPGGIFYTWDTLNHTSDMAVVFPVADTSRHIKGISYIYIPQSKACMAVHRGGYASESNEHNMLMRYVADKGQKQGAVIEEYVVGPYQEPDSTKWVTNIYYLMK